MITVYKEDFSELWLNLTGSEELGTTGGGYVVDYIAVDDAGTCGPCLDAQLRGPYLPGDPDSPYPGRVCRGRGRCRCRRELRHAPEEARRLREGG